MWTGDTLLELFRRHGKYAIIIDFGIENGELSTSKSEFNCVLFGDQVSEIAFIGRIL